MVGLPPNNNSTAIPATTPSTSIFTTIPSDTVTNTPLTSSTPTTTSPLPPTTTKLPPTSSSPPPVSSISQASPTTRAVATRVTSFVTRTNAGGSAETTTVVKTSIQAVTDTPTNNNAATTATDAAASASSSVAAGLASSNDSSSNGGGLQKGPKIAIAVVIPIVVVSLLVLAGLWFLRKRKARKDAEDLRRKEMEEYGLNPNHDPTLPAVGGSSTNGDEASTMRERDAGYRGWGTTSSNTRKASTTLSSNPGMARSDSGGNGYKGQNSPTGNMTQISDPQSGDPLMASHNEEDVGALGAGPAASGNRGVNRGPSNASSAYSGANRSDVSALSGDGPLPNGSPPYAQDFMHPDESYQNGWGDGQPVIRDVSARRNTRIENPSVIPQQGNAGIAQNF
ncbi:MAG: hypothetical protein MMC23_007270 [Stictis urceolatum]|nr:hypothetical protein [Stictis urceolata]